MKPPWSQYAIIPGATMDSRPLTDLSRGELAVLFTLYQHMDGRTFQMEVGAQSISDCCGFSVRWVERCIATLVEKNRIRVVDPGGGRGLSAVYEAVTDGVQNPGLGVSETPVPPCNKPRSPRAQTPVSRRRGLEDKPRSGRPQNPGPPVPETPVSRRRSTSNSVKSTSNSWCAPSVSEDENGNGRIGGGGGVGENDQSDPRIIRALLHRAGLNAGPNVEEIATSGLPTKIVERVCNEWEADSAANEGILVNNLRAAVQDPDAWGPVVESPAILRIREDKIRKTEEDRAIAELGGRASNWCENCPDRHLIEVFNDFYAHRRHKIAILIQKHFGEIKDDDELCTEIRAALPVETYTHAMATGKLGYPEPSEDFKF